MSVGAATAAAGGGAMLGTMGARPARLSVDAEDGHGAEAIVSGSRWNLLKGVLSREEQLQLFGFIHERDATDWERLAACMNPSPKTLQLVQQHGAQTAPLLSFGPDDEAAPVAVGLAYQLASLAVP